MDIDPVKTPELFSPESRSELVYVVVALLMALAAAAVGLRFYTRTVILNLIGLDDWIALAALTFILALGSATFVMTSQGLGRHIGTLPQPDGLKHYLRTFWVTITLYNFCILSTRLCFLAQYYRIMATKNMRRAVIVVTIFVIVWGISQITLSIFQCNPVEEFWDRKPTTVCLDANMGWYLNAAGNIISDVLVLLLPLPMIKGLNLPFNQKLILGAIFCLGFFTCAISIIRIHFLVMTLDTTFDTVKAQLWSIGEVVSGLLCAALPTLRPLAGQLFPRLFGSLRTRSSSSQMGSNWRPKDVGSDAARSRASRATRRGTRQFTKGRGGDVAGDPMATRPRETSVSGTAYLELSDDGIELQETESGGPLHDGRHRRAPSYPDAIYAGPIAGNSDRSVDIRGGSDALKTPWMKDDRDLFIRVKHDVTVDREQ